MSAWTPFDDFVGHCRRYEPTRLTSLLAQFGLEGLAITVLISGLMLALLGALGLGDRDRRGDAGNQRQRPRHCFPPPQSPVGRG